MNEPWTFLACNAGISCVDAHGNLLWHEWDAGQDVAERVLACVNACAGIDDPAAEIAGLRDSYKELCDIRADKVLFLPRPGYSDGAISINLSVAEQEGAIRDKLAEMGWARPDEAEQLRAENARLREALEGIMAYEPEHCACGDDGCTQTRERYDAARAELRGDHE